MSLIDFFHSFLGENQHDILWWQMCLRAVIIFLYGLLLVRLFARRAFGEQTPLDIVVAIVIGSDLSRAMTGNAPFFPTLAATATIVIIFWIFGHCAARWHWFSRLVKGNSITLMENGKIDRGKMRRWGVSPGDLEEAGRSSGIRALDRIRHAVLERNGKVSTIPRDKAD
jgi:uncharacterized membrane protein YcaP (DUF421 family)